jgi:hypothetical protein
LSKLLLKAPNDNVARGLFFSTKKRYKVLIKRKKRDFQSTILNNIEELHDKYPARYWKMIEDLRGIQSGSSSTEAIAPSKWFKYFKNLFATTPTSNPIFDNHILQEISTMENLKVFNELNFRIETKEVNKILKNLKSRKAVGLDGVANEMLKAGAEHFSKPLSNI